MTAPRADDPVLLCYDGSESAGAAISAAGRLLARRRALVCHASAEAAERIVAEGVELAEAAGFEAEPLPVKEGRETWATLVETGEAQRAAVMVAGAHGMSGIRRALLGSVSTGLVHHSSRPVLIVPASRFGEPPDGPLLLCYDGSAGAEGAVRAAAGLCAPRRAVVLHSWESWLAQTPALAGASASVRGVAAELDELADEQSEGLAEAGVRLAEEAGFEATGISEQATGPLWAAVLDAADANDCAGIVIGSRGLTGLSAALGSVSNGVLHHSTRPVFLVPPVEP